MNIFRRSRMTIDRKMFEFFWWLFPDNVSTTKIPRFIINLIDTIFHLYRLLITIQKLCGINISILCYTCRESVYGRMGMYINYNKIIVRRSLNCKFLVLFSICPFIIILSCLRCEVLIHSLKWSSPFVFPFVNIMIPWWTFYFLW